MNRLIDSALDKVKRMKDGSYAYSDDDVFVITGGQGARLISFDPSLRDRTAQPRKLLKNDGTISTQIVESAMHYGAPPPRAPRFNEHGSCAHRPVVPEHQRNPRNEFAGRHRLLLDQQLGSLRSQEHHRAGVVRGHGRLHLYSRQRDFTTSWRRARTRTTSWWRARRTEPHRARNARRLRASTPTA